MKKIWKKVLAGMLAVVMVLTSFAFDWSSASKAEAASGNVVAGGVLADVDFTKTDLAALDEQFTASEGTSDETRVTAEKVSEYWQKGETATQERVNVARTGTVDMIIMPFLLGLGGYEAAIINDGLTEQYTSTDHYADSIVPKDSDNPAKVTITFADSAYYEIDKVQIYWRDKRGCPEDFEIQVFNGNEWETKVKEEGYAYSSNPWSVDIEPTKCNAIRLVATKLRTDNPGGQPAANKYCLQLKEFEVYGTACTNAAIGGTPSMEIMLNDHPASFLNNGSKSGWTTTRFETSVDVEKTAAITFANNAYYKINHVQIFWRSSLGCPVAFEIQAQTKDGWKTVATEENNDTVKRIWSAKIEPVECNAIRLKATKLSLGEQDNPVSYCLMLNEFEAWGEKVEFLKTKTTYNSTEPTTTLLALKDVKVENFKAEIEMVYFDSAKTQYGLYFGQSETGNIGDAKTVQPLLWSAKTYGGVLASGVKQGTAQYVEEDAINYLTDISGNAYLGMFNPTGSTGVYSKMSITNFPKAINDGNIQTLNVEVIDSVLKLWWTGYEKAAWTAELTDYTGGYISLMSQGNDQGGIKSFKLQEYVERQENVIDFAEADLNELDKYFVASEGTSDDNRATAEKVSEYWQKGETATQERVNVARTGTVDMSIMPFLLGVGGYEATIINDGLTGQYTSTDYYADSKVPKDSDNPAKVTITFADSAYYEIDKVQIYWRDMRGCPEDFEIQVFNGNEWETKVKEERYAYSSNPWSVDIEPTKCNAIRLVATKLRTDNSGGQPAANKYCLQLKEFEVYGTACTNAAIGGTPSMEIMLNDHPASFLNNGSKSGWTATRFEDSADVEKTAAITFANNAYYKINHVQIFWRSSLGCPVAFEIQAQTKEGWKTVATEENNDTGERIWSTKIEPVECNAIRLKATKLSLGESGNPVSYCLMLNEFEAWGEKIEYLKTKTTYNSAEPTTTLLTLKDVKAKNFKAEIEMAYFNSAVTGYGLYFGQSAPEATTNAKSVTPFIWENRTYGGLLVRGVNQGSPQYLEEDIANYVTETTGMGMFNPTGSDGTYTKGSINGFPTAFNEGNIQTLNVEVIDGVLKVWWTGYEKAAWTAELTDYTGGYISLMSRGNDQGGIRSFRVSEIFDNDLQSNVDMSVEPLGDYTIVSVTNDIAGGILKNSTFNGNVKYDTTKFEYCTTVITDSKADICENVVATENNGSINVSFSSYNANTVTKLYFKNIVNELDYSEFNVKVDSITRENGKSVKATTTETIIYDYTGVEGTPDKLVDARDLVHAAKENKAPAEMRSALVGVGSDWVSGIVSGAKEIVYVDAVKGSYTGEGTQASPLNSMTLAAYRVADQGTIQVVGDYKFDSAETTIGMGQKTISITGGTLDLTGISTLDLNGAVTFDKVNMKVGNKTLIVFANGHNLTVNSGATFEGAIAELYGGNAGEISLASTNINLQAGNYYIIYGGSRGASTITGDTNVVLGGTANVNHPEFNVIKDQVKHAYNEVVCVYAGSRNGLVKGNTNVIVEGNATTSMVNGGGWGQNSEVSGTCNVFVNGGNVCGYYGGSLGGKVYKTNVVMTGGEAEQVLGGSWTSSRVNLANVSITGETNVTFTGGKVTRRIFGGCYNDETAKENFVKGKAVLKIGGTAEFSCSHPKSDYIICAGSRWSMKSNNEESTLYMTNSQKNSYETYIDQTTYPTYGYSKNKEFIDKLPE